MAADDITWNTGSGFAGVFGNPDAAALTVLAMHSLQHRGRDSCGIVVFDGHKATREQFLGLVKDNFSDADVLNHLAGPSALGHVSGATAQRNIQPLLSELVRGELTICLNGALTNKMGLREELVKKGAIFRSSLDIEVFLHQLARSQMLQLGDQIIEAAATAEGAFAIAAMTDEQLIVLRDRLGIRTVYFGKLNQGYAVATETAALEVMQARDILEIKNGQMITITETAVETRQYSPETPPTPCAMEYVYASQPSSEINGVSVHDVRERFGQRLALQERDGGFADVVVPADESSVTAAIGFAQKTALPFRMGIGMDRGLSGYRLHTDRASRLPLVKSVFLGKRIALVDNSVVTGRAIQKLITRIRDLGATEVHVRVASPQINHPDYYGAGMKPDLITNRGYDTIDELKKLIGADSLSFLSLDGFYSSIGAPRRSDGKSPVADHCFTGDYPTRLTDLSHEMEYNLEDALKKVVAALGMSTQRTQSGVWLDSAAGDPTFTVFVPILFDQRDPLSVSWPWNAREAAILKSVQAICEDYVRWQRTISIFYRDSRVTEYDSWNDPPDDNSLLSIATRAQKIADACSATFEIVPDAAAAAGYLNNADPCSLWYATEMANVQFMEAGFSTTIDGIAPLRSRLIEVIEYTHDNSLAKDYASELLNALQSVQRNETVDQLSFVGTVA